MIAKIAKTIQNDLITALHSSEGVEVYNHQPETVTSDDSIHVIRRRKSRLGNEIGMKIGSQWRYTIEIIIAVTHGDFESGISRLDKIERLVIENLLHNSTLYGLQNNEDGQLEQVIHYDVAETEYPQTAEPFDNNTQIALLTVIVDTDLTAV